MFFWIFFNLCAVTYWRKTAANNLELTVGTFNQFLSPFFIRATFWNNLQASTLLCGSENSANVVRFVRTCVFYSIAFWQLILCTWTSQVPNVCFSIFCITFSIRLKQHLYKFYLSLYDYNYMFQLKKQKLRRFLRFTFLHYVFVVKKV